LARGLRRLFPYGLADCVLDPANRVLNFTGGFFIPALDLKLGVARGFADSFLHRAFGLLDRSLDAILSMTLHPLFLRPRRQSIVRWASAR
jgi:hypothetical protein